MAAVARDRRKRVPRTPPTRPGRPAEKPGRITAAAIRAYVARAEGESEKQHNALLENALRCWAGLPFELPASNKPVWSPNLRAMEQGILAHIDPVRAAESILAELAQSYHRDEAPVSSTYESWTALGRLLALRGLERWDGYDGHASDWLRRDLGYTQALMALLAVPGVVRGVGSKVVYRGPVVRAAGMRSLPSRVANPSTTPAASALLGGGEWLRAMDPVEQAIHSLKAELSQGGWERRAITLDPLWRWYKPEETLGNAVHSLRLGLEGIRLAVPYLIQRYADGSVLSALLGPIGPSSTAQIRGCLVRGPEAEDAEILTPFGAKKRNVPASDAYIRDGLLVAGLGSDQHTSGVVTMKLPTAPPILTVRLGAHEPAFEGEGL